MSNKVLSNHLYHGELIGSNYWLLPGLLIVTSLPQMNGIPKFLAYSVVLLFYVLIGYMAINSRKYCIIGRRMFFGCFLTVTTFLTLHLLFSPSIPELVRIPIFVVITGLNLFYIPRLYRPTEFFHAAALVGGLFVVFSSSVLVVGEYGNLQLYHVTTDLIPMIGPQISAVQGPFRNPNALATVALAGALGSAGWYIETGNKIALGSLLVNGFGISISNSQAALIALLAGLSCVIVSRWGSKNLLRVLIAGGVVGAVSLTLITIFPPHSIVIDYLGVGRYYLWKATILGTFDQPLGHGAGIVGEKIAPHLNKGIEATTTHNGWLRLFFTSGLIGGAAYTFLFLLPLPLLIRKVDVPTVLSCLVMLIGISLMDFFHGLSLFGLSFLSVVLSLSLGYVQIVPLTIELEDKR